MARKQTRRCVSLSRPNYEAARQEALRRGMTITALVESALGAFGVPNAGRSVDVDAQQ